MIRAKYFTYQELIKSQAASRLGLSNDIEDVVHLANMQRLLDNVLEPLRKLVKKPVTINSAYRSPSVNKAVGGAATSQHCLGEAADIEVLGMPNAKLAKTIATTFTFDQLILEFYNPNIPDSGWVHVSYREGRNRGQVLRASIVNGKTKYEPYHF